MFLKLLVTIEKYTCNVLTLLSMARIPTKEFGFAFISISTVLPVQKDFHKSYIEISKGHMSSSFKKIIRIYRKQVYIND